MPRWGLAILVDMTMETLFLAPRPMGFVVEAR